MTKLEKYKKILGVIQRDYPETPHSYIQLYRVDGTNKFMLYSIDVLLDDAIQQRYSYLKKQSITIYKPYTIIEGNYKDADIDFDMRDYFTLPQFLLSMDDEQFELWLRLQ